ncbi:MAG: ParB/RepB/Spo0J family partition protein [Acidobacteria bacterium]|nr:ParB/RepB/Spo0J family partition protein [Acidobacteriota bacterium]
MEPTQPITKAHSQSSPKRGLGRGLEALLPATHPAGESIRQIEVTRITPNPYQSRQQFHSERLRELSASIKTHGVVQPVVVRQQGDRYTLIAGERRWRAAQLAGLATVPAIVRQVPENHILELTLIENIQREDLNPIETAEAFARLTREAGLTHEQIAERTGKDRATVTNFLRLLKLPEEVRKRVATGELSMGHARALLALPTETAQKALAARIVTQGLSVRQAEALVKTRDGRISKPNTLRKIWAQALEDPNVRAAVEGMERALGTRVRLAGDDMHGKIMIEYYSSQDLDRIYGVIVGKR